MHLHNGKNLQIPALLNANTSHSNRSNKETSHSARHISHSVTLGESEASYRDTQNVWESSTKTDFSLIHIFLENHKLCECCPKALTSHRRHHIQTCRMCERVLRKPIFHCFLWFDKNTKCVSVARKHTKAIWSIISRQTECVRGFYENRFFIDSYIFRKPQSVWVLFENSLKPSEASYVDRQNVWEGSTKIDFSSIITFLENHKVCECCPKTLQSHQKQHI